LRQVSPLNDQVNVGVPLARNAVASELQERRTAIHPGSPPSSPPKAAEAAVEAIKLGGKLSVTATEGECDESVDAAEELAPEVSGNAGCPLTLTGPAPAIMAFGACNAETVWIGTAAEHPGIAAAVSEAIKASSRGSNSAKSQVNQFTIIPPSRVSEANASIGRHGKVVTGEGTRSLRFCFFGNKRSAERRRFHGHRTTFGARRTTTLGGRSGRGVAGAGSRA